MKRNFYRRYNRLTAFQMILINILDILLSGILLFYMRNFKNLIHNTFYVTEAEISQ